MTVNAPPKVSRPAFRPSRKISAVSEIVTAAGRITSAAGNSESDPSRPRWRLAFVHSS